MNDNQNEDQYDQEIFPYFRISDNLFQNSRDRANNIFPSNINNSRMTREQIIMDNKDKKDIITGKFQFALFRFILLIFFYFLESNPLTLFLIRLIEFLLIHDALVVSNYILMEITLSYYYYTDVNNLHRFPNICILFDTLNNFVFFSWFIYGNLCILTDKSGVESSLKQNVLITYYLTILILCGFFIFAKVIFYIIFFISFCPCLIYAFISDIRNEYLVAQRAKRIQQLLVPIYYKEYLEKHGNESDTCIICSDNFKDDDQVVFLPCSFKHVFHIDCIMIWFKKKTICPICRSEIGNN